MPTVTKSLLCSAFLLLCVLIANFGRAEGDCGGFSASCTNFQINSFGIWFSDCKSDSSGSVYDTHAEMSTGEFLSNNNGVLVEGAGYLQSCQDLGAFAGADGGVFLKANCADLNGHLQLTTYDVNKNIVNTNGAISWNFCRRRSLLDASSESTFEQSEALEKLQMDAGALHRKILL